MLSRLVNSFKFSRVGMKSQGGDHFEGLKKYLTDYEPERAEKGLGEKIDFEKDMKPALDYYTSIGFTKQDLNLLFKTRITALCLNNGSNDRLKQDIISFSSFFKTQYNLSNDDIRRIVQNNHNLLSLSSDEFT